MEFGVSLSPKPFAVAVPWLFAGDLPRGLAAASALGHDVVELSLRSADDIDIRSLRDELARLGLRVSAITTAPAKILDGLVMSSADADVRRATVERLIAVLDLAGELRADLIIGGIRGRLEGTPDARSRQREHVIECMRVCARRAAALAVRLLLEPINRYESNLVNRASEGAELLAEVGEPCAGLLLDTFHMNIEEPCIESSLREVSHLLGYVHIADSNRMAPGCGHIDFGAVLATLVEIGFAGPLVAEILPLPDDETAARTAAEFVAARLGACHARA